MLRNVAALPEDILQDCLGALDRAEILVRIDSELEDSIEFQHEMVRQVTYELMVEKVRENIHGRILAAFESDETWSDGPDTLCYHAMRAKDWLKAFGYGRGAAQKCLVRSAYADAVDYFGIAMSSLDKMPITLRGRQMQLTSGWRREWHSSGPVRLPSGSISEKRPNAGLVELTTSEEGRRHDRHGGWTEFLRNAN